jgi:GntR family transcriptional regulator
MTAPAYVSIAGEYARQIRSGRLLPRTQLPTYVEIAKRHGVSDIVARNVVKLLARQGLVRSVERRGVFVADRPNLVRTSPERQLEKPEQTFEHESELEIHVERETEQVQPTGELAELFGISSDTEVTHTITRASEGGRPVSISDTYQPQNVDGISDAIHLEETIADRIPAETHADFLRTQPGDLVKTVNQRFIDANDRVIMISDVSYPHDRYDAFVFRMTLRSDS